MSTPTADRRIPGSASEAATPLAAFHPRPVLGIASCFVLVELAVPGAPIWVCRGQKVSWARAWPAAKHYN